MSRNILLLTHRLPYPPNKGDRIRSWNILKALSGTAPVHLLSFADAGEVSAGPPQALARHCASVTLVPKAMGRFGSLLDSILRGHPASFAGFRSQEFAAAVADILARKRIGTVYAYSTQMGEYLPGPDAGARRILDCVDCDSAKFADLAGYASPMDAWIYTREARLVAEAEKRLTNQADACVFINAREADAFRLRTGAISPIHIMPNGVDLDDFRPTPFHGKWRFGPLILFCGQMDYLPNIQAAQHFARNIFPKIRRVFPSAIFAVIGRAPTLEVQALGLLPGVRVFGEVADVRPWHALAHVVVAPLLVSRGVPNKILEAMAMGCPIVAAPKAIAGLRVEADVDLLVADGAEAFANATLKILRDPRFARRLGTYARNRVERDYGWPQALASLSDIISPRAQIGVRA